MESQYLRANIGNELSSALAALYTYGIDLHNDSSHPHKDPISFIARYLLEKSRVQTEITREQLLRQPLLDLQEQLYLQVEQVNSQREATLSDLKKALEARSLVEDESQQPTGEAAGIEAEPAFVEGIL